MPETLSPERWQSTEEQVIKAEKAKRQAVRASQEIYKETDKKTKSILTVEGETQENPDRVVSKAKRPRVMKRALEQESHFTEQAEELLGNSTSPERALISLEYTNLSAALKKEREIEKKRQRLIIEEGEILKLSDTLGGSELAALNDIQDELRTLDEEHKSLTTENPEAFYGLHLQELKEYKQDLAKGRIVETPYVKKQAEDVVSHFRAGKPVLIYGHLGSGKTELAMYVAKEYLKKEALVVSGSKNMSLAELYGHQVLALDKINKQQLDQFAKEVEGKFEEWVESNKDASEEEKNRAHDRLLQIYLTELKGGTISQFYLGPIYQAMKEGLPVIIDEVNAIPHEILISLNHILTRRPGENMNVQQDSGEVIKIAEGFGVMMTANLNQGQKKYVERQDMDPAFLSRLYKLEHDYLPQKNEGTLEDEAGEENELFHLLLSRVMDKHGNIEAPKDTIEKLWNLAKAARTTQNVFSGKEINSAFYFHEAAGRSVKYVLQESVLSLRALDAVITQWQKEGYKQELDYYLWKEFVAQSTVPSDRAYLYQVLKDQYGFFTSTDWEQHPNYGASGRVTSFDVKAPKNQALKHEFFGPREVVQFAYGKAPDRTVWPELKSEEGVSIEASLRDEAKIEKYTKRQAFIDSLGAELRELEAMIVEQEALVTTEEETAPESTLAKPPERKKSIFGKLFGPKS